MPEGASTIATEDLLDLVNGLAPLAHADPRTVFFGFVRPVHARFEQVHAEYVSTFDQIRSSLASSGDDFQSTVAMVKGRLWLSETQRIKVRAAVEVFTDIVWERDAKEPRLTQLGGRSEGDLRWQGPERFRYSQPPPKPSAVFMPYFDSVYRYLTAGHDGWLSWDGGLWRGMSQRWYMSVLQALAIASHSDDPPAHAIDTIIEGTSLSLKDRDRLGPGVFAQRLVDSIAVLLQQNYAVAVSEYLKLASTIGRPASPTAASPEKAPSYERVPGVFVSYSHDDKEFAQKLRHRLDSSGVRVWVDERNLSPGDRILDAINTAIQGQDKLLLCCSQTSLRSWWVKDEIRKAMTIERNEERDLIVPLDLDGALYVWDDGLAEDIRSRLAVDFVGWKTDEGKFNSGVERLTPALKDFHAASPA